MSTERVIMVRESEWREMREALKALLVCPAIFYGNLNHPVWGCKESAEAEIKARAALAKSEGADDVLLRGRIAYALTKQLVIDMPTARAAVDEAFRNLALTALAKSEATHPAPDGCGREGKHQWGGPERDREVCVNCGATRVLEGGSAGEPVAWWVHDLHVARQPVKARARYPEPTEFLYPASREQDARNAAKMLGGKCTPLFAHPALTAGKPEQEGR